VALPWPDLKVVRMGEMGEDFQSPGQPETTSLAVSAELRLKSLRCKE
jgi:hypothetical protein